MKKSSQEDAIEGILKLTDRLFRALLPTVPKRLLNIDVTMPQMKIMLMLFIIGPMRMSDLADNLHVTLATATRLVDRLVEKGFVVRENQPDDRRVVLCNLSNRGLNMVNGIWETARNNIKSILRNLDIGKLGMLAEVLEDMLQSTGRIQEQLAG